MPNHEPTNARIHGTHHEPIKAPTHTWCVTSTRVLPCRAPVSAMQSRKMCSPTWASTAERTSSLVCVCFGWLMCERCVIGAGIHMYTCVHEHDVGLPHQGSVDGPRQVDALLLPARQINPLRLCMCVYACGQEGWIDRTPSSIQHMQARGWIDRVPSIHGVDYYCLTFSPISVMSPASNSSRSRPNAQAATVRCVVWFGITRRSQQEKCAHVCIHRHAQGQKNATVYMYPLRTHVTSTHPLALKLHLVLVVIIWQAKGDIVSQRGVPDPGLLPHVRHPPPTPLHAGARTGRAANFCGVCSACVRGFRTQGLLHCTWTIREAHLPPISAIRRDVLPAPVGPYTHTSDPGRTARLMPFGMCECKSCMYVCIYARLPTTTHHATWASRWRRWLLPSPPPLTPTGRRRRGSEARPSQQPPPGPLATAGVVLPLPGRGRPQCVRRRRGPWRRS